MRIIIPYLLAWVVSQPLQAQDAQPPLTRMLFVMDASNSMNAFWGNQPKITTARELQIGRASCRERVSSTV